MIAVKNILVSTDFGEAAEIALMYGRSLACQFGAKLHVLNVVENLCLNPFVAENFTTMSPQIQAELEDAMRKQLDALLTDSDKNGPVTNGIVITSSSPALAIINYAKESEIDLIIMGTHGRGPLAHFVMGSVAERVVRLAPCPVLTVKHPEHEFVLPGRPAVGVGA